MAGKSIDDVFNDVIQDFKEIARSTVVGASVDAHAAILKEAKSYLQMYYNNYTPKYYKRTYNLQKAITPVIENNSNKSNVSYIVGVEYSAWKLKGAYKSHSRFHQSGDIWKPVTNYSKLTTDNGVPEPEWVLDNFLEGVHPWAQDDTESTNTLMKDFFDNKLPDRIEQYVQKRLFDEIISRL